MVRYQKVVAVSLNKLEGGNGHERDGSSDTWNFNHRYHKPCLQAFKRKVGIKKPLLP